MDKLFEMINQQFKAVGRKYQVLPNFGIVCREYTLQNLIMGSVAGNMLIENMLVKNC